MRMMLLVMPPVIPQVHDELRISETQVGLLIGLPLAMLAVAAIRHLAATAVIGIAGAVSMTAILALPPFLSLPADLPRTAAGMFTISYTCAIIIPTICGALWDLTGKPWTAFVPLCLCAVALTVLGTIATRRRPAVQAAPGT
jgi:cyanate permease